MEHLEDVTVPSKGIGRQQAEEVDWDKLDKQRFFVMGAGMFSGVTTVLYPLTVVKTKQMALPGIQGGFQGVKQTVSTIYRTEGVPGFYRGFATVICGTIPARVVYLGTLEWTKAEARRAVSGLGLSEPTVAGVSNFTAGAVASMAVQTVAVPIDIISQKQMVHGDHTVSEQQQLQRASSTSGRPPMTPAAGAGAAAAPAVSSSAASTATAAAARTAAVASSSGSGAAAAAVQASHRISALQLIRTIVREEGIGGLYRGFGVSVATFVPSSAVWWSAYGTYQKVIWSLVSSTGGPQPQQRHSEQQPDHAADRPHTHSTGEVIAVQMTSSVLAGCTSSLVTTPLDLIKTRIQVAYKHHGLPLTVGEVARQILKEDGPSGFLRGAVPRMMNASLWGTCMVSVYEFLKRVCQKSD